MGIWFIFETKKTLNCRLERLTTATSAIDTAEIDYAALSEIHGVILSLC